MQYLQHQVCVRVYQYNVSQYQVCVKMCQYNVYNINTTNGGVNARDENASYSLYLTTKNTFHISFRQTRASRPAAQTTPYSYESLRTYSRWSLHAARASRADSADRAFLVRSADEGLTLRAPLPGIGLRAAHSRGTLHNLKS